MGTSRAKALRRAARGQPSKVSLRQEENPRALLRNTPRTRRRATGDQALTREVMMKKNTVGRPKGRKGTEASLVRRVSHAHRGSKNPEGPQAHSRGPVMRKRRASKTANRLGHFSVPFTSGTPMQVEKGTPASGLRPQSMAEETKLLDRTGAYRPRSRAREDQSKRRTLAVRTTSGKRANRS